MRRQQVRIVGRGRSHRQNLAGLRIQRHDGTFTTLQSVVGDVLKLRVDGQLHASTLSGRTTEQLRHTVVELAIARAGKLLIHGSFQTSCTVDSGEVAGQSRVLERVVVHALIVVLIIRLHRGCNLRAVHHDGTARRTVVIVQRSAIPRVSHQSLRIEELNVAEGTHQQDKHARGRHPHAANRPIHSSHLQNPLP